MFTCTWARRLCTALLRAAWLLLKCSRRTRTPPVDRQAWPKPPATAVPIPQTLNKARTQKKPSYRTCIHGSRLSSPLYIHTRLMNKEVQANTKTTWLQVTGARGLIRSVSSLSLFLKNIHTTLFLSLSFSNTSRQWKPQKHSIWPSIRRRILIHYWLVTLCSLKKARQTSQSLFLNISLLLFFSLSHHRSLKLHLSLSISYIPFSSSPAIGLSCHLSRSYLHRSLRFLTLLSVWLAISILLFVSLSFFHILSLSRSFSVCLYLTVYVSQILSPSLSLLSYLAEVVQPSCLL